MFYVGDDCCDIEVGCVVGCMIVVVFYGYFGDGGLLESWGVDLIIDYLIELMVFFVN